MKIWSSALTGVLCWSTLPALAATNVTTWRYDVSRTGQNLNETLLQPSNVNSASFGKLRSYAADGDIYAQPLYMAGLSIGGAQHNVVFVATQHDSVYAFDADQSQQLWKASMIDTAHGAASGATTVPSDDVGTHDVYPEIGITGTPVIDPSTNTLYVVAKSKENGAYVQRLHALDLSTGNEKSHSPVVLAGSVPGSGSATVNGRVSFDPKLGLQRMGLLLYNGHIYFATSSHGDNGPYHGWVFAYDATTLQQTGIYSSSPNGAENGIWESGAGLAADTVGGVSRMFLVNGNGTFGASLPYTNTQNYGNGVERLDLSNGGLRVLDEWTPFEQQALDAGDVDQGSGGILLLPDQPGTHTHELIQVGKNGRIELLDRDNLGGYNTSLNNVVQEISGQTGGMYSTPAYWNGNVYFWASGDTLKQFTLQNGRLSTTPAFTGSVNSSFPGASPVVSANGNSNAIIWGVKSDRYNASQPSVLYAFDATNVSKLLYSSSQNAARDTAGTAVKFSVPVVANGLVFVAGHAELDVYGELSSSASVTPTPTISPAAGSYTSTQTVSLSDAAAGAVIYYTTDGSVPTTSSKAYTGPITVSSTTTIEALAVSSNAGPSSVAVGTYTISSPKTIDFSNGFASVAGLTLNGSAIHSDDSRLQLTNGGLNQAGSFFWNTPVNITKFTTDFTFQLSGTKPLADGITFTMQNVGTTALGSSGGGLGYGADQPNGPQGIAKSIALKFDTYSNAGEGADSSGVYLNGASPTVPAVDLSNSGVVLSSGDTIAVHETYDGYTLTVTITDLVTGASYTGSGSGDITQALGEGTAYVGFTGGSGAITSSQKILTWTFNSGVVTNAK